MGLLRRMPRGLYSSYTTTGNYGTVPNNPPLCDLNTGNGYRSGVAGTISKSTFEGYTITQLSIESNYQDSGLGTCQIAGGILYFIITGYTGPVTLLKRIVIPSFYNGFGALYEFKSSDVSSYSAGNWQWVSDGMAFGSGGFNAIIYY